MKDRNETDVATAESGVAAEEQRDLTLIAVLVGIIIVAGGLFIFNSAGQRYTTARYQPLPNTLPVMTPSSVPVPDAKPAQ